MYVYGLYLQFTVYGSLQFNPKTLSGVLASPPDPLHSQEPSRLNILRGSIRGRLQQTPGLSVAGQGRSAAAR